MNRYVSTVAVIQALGLMKSVSPRGRDRVKTQTDATAQGRGIWESGAALFVAANVSLHGARPWHLGEWRSFIVAANVKLHGARPWHLGEWRSFYCSRERETPRRKAVASGRVAQLCL